MSLFCFTNTWGPVLPEARWRAWEARVKVTVHSFKWHDVNTNKTAYPETKRTAEWIIRTQGAEAIPGTAEVVDERELDMHGAYHPKTMGRRNG